MVIFHSYVSLPKGNIFIFQVSINYICDMYDCLNPPVIQQLPMENHRTKRAIYTQ